MSKLKKCLIVLVAILCVIVIYTIVTCIIFYRPIKMELGLYNNDKLYRAYNILYNEYNEDMIYKRNKEEYRRIIEKELDLKHYLYFEREFKSNNDGVMFIGVRTIIIDSTLSEYQYCVAFTHEALHFVKFSGNETYITFEAFKYLYENEDEELHNMGACMGFRQLLGAYKGDYDCSKYIVNYLTNKWKFDILIVSKDNAA